MNRLHNLDYLRGIAAFGIMLYHYLSWTYGNFESKSFMGRVGVYGVSIFYVLSGLTLYHVYIQRMVPNREDLFQFAKKRFFRIFPLLWLATIASVLLKREIPNWENLFLNLSGLFGFVKWDTYFSTGVWSIGNELVFYVFFPFFIYFSKNNKSVFYLISTLIFLIYLQFAFSILSPEKTITEQWRNYVNPLNQVFLFLGGYLIGFLSEKKEIRNEYSWLFMIGGLALFTSYPSYGDNIYLVTGYNRLIFTLSCFMMVLGIYKVKGQLPKNLQTPLSWLGEASYSVYLLHPIVFSLSGIALKMILGKLGMPDLIRFNWLIAIPVSLVMSYFVYHYFEKYFMKLGHRSKSK